MRIYLDNCCYNRPFDNQNQTRIRIESEAILEILKICEYEKEFELIARPILQLEIDNTLNVDKREKVMSLYSLASLEIPFTASVKQRAKELCSISKIKNMDSLHIAFAESGFADIMLTTDDKLIKECSNLNLSIKVINPVIFLLNYVRGE